MLEARFQRVERHVAVVYAAGGAVDLVVLRIGAQGLLQLAAQRIVRVGQLETRRDHNRIRHGQTKRLPQEGSVYRKVLRVELIDALDSAEQLSAQVRVIA